MTTRTGAITGIGRVPPHLAIGLALVAVAWPLAWLGPKPFSSYTFFPLWLGYILTVDGLTVVRAGTSLLSRSRGRFALLFVFSTPLWWLFELANQFLRNWHYHLPRDYSPLAYALLCSIAFSTVMPAVFVTAELWRTFPLFHREIRWLRIAPSRTGLLAIAAVGLVMCVASLAFPKVLFPLIWIGGFLAIDPVNRLTGGGSIAAQVARGRWDTVLVLFAAGITCGFFWEMWNSRSMPKWTYEIPYVDFLRVFEMPILGYGGYLPFALELYAAYHLFHTVLSHRPDTWLAFDDPRM